MYIKNAISQKIYKYNKSRTGNTIFNKRPIGVMVAGLDPNHPTTVCMGYSLCHPEDKYDYVVVENVSIHSPGFGKNLAISRAIDWKIIQSDCKTPPSITKVFIEFTRRCMKYYKGATLPMWAFNQMVNEDESAQRC